MEKNATGIVNRKLPTFILIHGWTNNGTTGWIVNCAEKFHQVGQFNVIAVDWSVLAAGDYFSAVKNLKTVGYRIRDFIKQVPFGVDRVQIIAHSLGAHVAAYVGNALGREKVGTIVGLDPAGPLFDWPVLLPFNSRLTFDDATVVQVIHTMVFLTGVTVPSGTIDFYVNRGVDQPGCSNGTIAQNSKTSNFHLKMFLMFFLVRCNHNKSYTYYIQTINNSTMYPGLKQCRRFRCRPNIAYMGHNDNKNKFGVYNVTAEGTE